MWIKYCRYIIPTGTFLVGGLLVWMIFGEGSNAKSVQDHTCQDQYPFVYTGINCEKNDQRADQIESLHFDITRIINEEKAAKHLSRASVFYRDLDTRRWFGINDTDKFYPASLIKLPIAVTYYKIAELEPEIFDRKFQISADAGDNSDQHYPPDDPLVPGQSYTVREMIRHMLVYSDNAPFAPLANNAGVLRDKVLADLGIEEPASGEGWKVTTRIYAAIFRNLYNAAYLNVNFSNELLQTLSETAFKKGIVSGVPSGVKVAHKFGEAAGTDQNGNVVSQTLNDCGIVYKPKDPFILCIMTEGQNYDALEKVIQKITATAYDALE